MKKLFKLSVMGVVATSMSVLLTACGGDKKSNENKFSSIRYVDEQRCYIKDPDGNKSPMIHLLLVMYGDDKAPSDEMVTQEIANLIERGCDLNEQTKDHSNLLPLNLAVMFNVDSQIPVLINGGANPNLPLKHGNKNFDGKNAFEFSELIFTKVPEEKKVEQKITNDILQSFKK